MIFKLNKHFIYKKNDSHFLKGGPYKVRVHLTNANLALSKIAKDK